jgi:hypothetical protein
LQRLYPIAETTTTTTGFKKSSTASININNHKKELKKLNHSILIAYLDLLEILAKAPNTQIQIEQTPPPGASSNNNSDEEPPRPIIIYKTLREQKLEDMELLFIHMHHLINELRPHQARDNIRCILEMQRQQRAETARKFKAHLSKIMTLLRTCIQSVSKSNELSGHINNDPVFMDDLNSLMNNADRLTQALDRFDDTKSSAAAAAATKKKLLKLTNGSGEEEMKAEYDTAEVVARSFNKKCTITSGNGRRAGSRAENWNCEENDLILCDLIDEYLVKGNEF